MHNKWSADMTPLGLIVGNPDMQYIINVSYSNHFGFFCPKILSFSGIFAWEKLLRVIAKYWKLK